MTDRDWALAALEPRPEDSTDVRWALETALGMWSRGDREQTLVWVEHALQAASGDGASDRADALGRAKTELAAGPEPRAHTAPSSGPETVNDPELAPRTKPITGEDADGPVTRKRPGKSALVTAPYKIAPDEVTNLFVPDPALLEALRDDAPETTVGSAPPISDTPVPAAIPTRPRPPTPMTDGLDKTITNIRPEAHPTREGHEHTMVMDAEELAAPSRSIGTQAPSTVGSPQAALEPMRALRVVIQSGSGREIVVRLLGEGEAPPPGAQEALLIALGRSGK